MLLTISIQPTLDLDPLKNFVLQRVLPEANRSHSGMEHFPLELYREIHAMGWLQASVPQHLGGAGASTLDLACIARALAYGSSGVMMSSIVNFLGVTAISLYAAESLQKELLPPYLEEFSLWSFCMTEPNAGSDVARITTRARRAPGGFLLTGQKCFITNANYSEHLIVFARTADDNSANGAISAFYVPVSAEGVSHGKALEKLGQKDSNTGELFFDEVFVPNAHLLGTIGHGLQIMHRCIQRSKTMVSAGAIGICDRAHDLVTQHLATKVHYGKPLLELATVRSLIAQLQTQAEGGWLLACQAAATWDSGLFAIKEASMAKLWTTNLAVKYANEALELFGAYGYSKEYEIERLYRDSKALEILEGSTFIQQLLIAKELFPIAKELKQAA